jgi:hypothetical protein
VTKYNAVLNSGTATAAMIKSATSKIAAATTSKNAIISATKAGKYSNGGMVKPSYFADGGMASGTDVVPAMLTPGEFIISRGAASKIGLKTLNRLNSGMDLGENLSGLTAEVYNVTDSSNNYNQMRNTENRTSNYSSVYNSYGINVNVRSGANPEEIARTVTAQIQKTNDQRLRGNRY